MKIKYFAVLASMSVIYPFSVYSAEPSYAAISRCAFVYGGIFEAGRDIPHAELFHFGQSRLSFIGGYIKANQSNLNFNQVFESNLTANKRAGLDIMSSTKKAVYSKNQPLFTSVINKAIACDKQTGIITDFIPKL